MIRFQLAFPRHQRKLAQCACKLIDVHFVRIAYHRNHQTIFGIGRKSQMIIMFVDQRLAILGKRRVHFGKFLQRRNAGFYDECQRRESDATFFRRAFKLLPFRFEFGYVGKIMLRDMRQINPARLQARTGDFLDPRQWRDLDFAELREIDRRHFWQSGCLTWRRSAARQNGFYERLDVVLQDSFFRAAAFDLDKVDAKLPRQLTYGRARVRLRKTGLVDCRQ